MMCSAPESPFIIRAEHSRALRDAQAILAEARGAAARIRADAEAERSAALQAARLEGLRQGGAEAASFAAAAAAAVEMFWAEREAELRDVALAIAHRILARIPADDLMARLATEAIAEHGRDTGLALRTSPDMAAVLRAALQGHEHGDRVVVVGDPRLGPGDCVLTHPRGRSDIGLLAQFRAMVQGTGDGDGPGHP
jgi:flagellar biosynthesis/type III secretory pathway protein FliH